MVRIEAPRRRAGRRHRIVILLHGGDSVSRKYGSVPTGFRVKRSRLTRWSTPFNLIWALGADSEKGFNEAVDEMIPNLEQQLVAFQEKVKVAPEECRAVRADGGSTGGALLSWRILATHGRSRRPDPRCDAATSP